MIYDFRLPDIGEGFSEGELLDWSVAAGDAVEESQEIASISTDKVTVELPSPCSGVVKELLWQPGDVVPVGEVLMRFELPEGAAPPQDAHAHQSAKDAPSAEARPAQKPAAKIKAAPAIRRQAKELGIDLGLVTGSGPDGQILAADLEAHVTQAGASAGTEKLSAARRAAAERLTTSARNQVTTTLSFDVFADGVLEACESLKDEAEALGVRLTPLPVIAERVAAALKAHPRFNATVVEDELALQLCERVDLGIAVDTDVGLVVPVVRDAGRLSTLELARAIAEAADKARAGTLGPGDVANSSFTLSSTGGLETATMTSAAPIINYPNVATLWVSRITTRPRVRDGKLEAGPMMACSLSFDHRFLHGADGLAFINALDESLFKGAV